MYIYGKLQASTKIFNEILIHQLVHFLSVNQVTTRHTHAPSPLGKSYINIMDLIQVGKKDIEMMSLFLLPTFHTFG